jgi:hypothetical protein
VIGAETKYADILFFDIYGICFTDLLCITQRTFLCRLVTVKPLRKLKIRVVIPELEMYKMCVENTS